MMADYAACYGGFPAPDMAWRLFCAAAKRASRQDAKAKLGMLDAVRAGIAAAFGDKTVQTMRDDLVREAYPVAEREVVFHRNLLDPREQGAAEA